MADRETQQDAIRSEKRKVVLEAYAQTFAPLVIRSEQDQNLKDKERKALEDRKRSALEAVLETSATSN